MGVFGRDSALVGLFGDEIEFVSGEGDDDVFVCLSLKFFDPGLCLIERGLYLSVVRWDRGEGGETYRLSNVIDDNSAVCIAIVHGSQRLVSLLASRVPNLKFDGCRVVEGYCLGEESSADG